MWRLTVLYVKLQRKAKIVRFLSGEGSDPFLLPVFIHKIPYIMVLMGTDVSRILKEEGSKKEEMSTRNRE